MLRSHPKSRVVLTLRDPRKWVQSRLRKHGGTDVADWTVEAPCGAFPGPTVGETDAAADALLIYQAWALCIADRRPWLDPATPREPVALVNLFHEEPPAVAATLSAFFAGYGQPSELADGGACARRALNDSDVFQRLVRVCLGYAKKGGWPRTRDFARQCS